ncbi:N-acetylglucosamine-6-phosphate deacetylase [Deinococcus peraridilitoris DSM 19664]|uniref:N-acetylglucosamine-6-phosphate deacetylase n=1 Tax=Deinococcus peraridilitoris (strain DSM 19664 / LMG 22246 / CIP 109416 / KR-200) TaxID=937777 RepID=L0A2S4_DEIPD|nr:N-acetylglucosamine-6-phosphate deacetylase [Deinococcus peraridilitoris DSM 19664]
MKIGGQILTPRGLLSGQVTFEGGRIQHVVPGPAVDRFVLPGFIDSHVHGGGGGDTMDGPAGVRTLAQFHAQHGTTTLLPTTMTAPWPEVMNALRGVAEVRAFGVPGGADIPGAHLEGPFISPRRLGAQPPHALLPQSQRIGDVLALEVVRVVTLAPELEGAPKAAEAFAGMNVRVSLGHTAGRCEDAQQLMQRVRALGGVVGGTHLFNAMGGLAGREPGVVGALLASAHAYAELILDLHHVHETSFRAALAALGNRLTLVTDAIRAAGLGDGISELGGQEVQVRNGRAQLSDGTLAGSVLTLDVALRNALSLGLSLEETSALLSANPARYLGLSDRGRIESGCRADLVVLDTDYAVQEVWIKGSRVA